MERSRRKKHLVDKKLQYRLLAFNGLYFLVFVAAMAIALFAPLVSEFSVPDLSASQKGEVAAKVLYIHATFWPAVVFLLFILGAHSVLVSNKIAGPLHRFQRMFEKIRNGDLSHTMTIRKGDYLMSEQTKITGMINALREKIERIRGEQGAMEQALKELRRLLGDTMNAEARASLASLEEHHRRLKEDIAFFKTSPGPGSHE